jgi:hypothetical protein
VTPAEWAEVFHAGAHAISGIDMLRQPGLPPELYGAAAVKRALEAMELKCEQIAGRQIAGRAGP